LQVIFRKRATSYRALLRKMTYEDKASYDSTPPCICRCEPFLDVLHLHLYMFSTSIVVDVLVSVDVFVYMYIYMYIHIYMYV